MANFWSSGFVCHGHNDATRASLHGANMPTRRRPVRQLNWFLRDWMAHYGMRQVDLMERTGWSKTTASLIYNGKQDFTPRIVDEAAAALNIAVYELFLPPDSAMALRRQRADSVRIAADNRIPYTPEPEFVPIKRAS
jgi:transcriptional regulator with XRE-family HTH domain